MYNIYLHTIYADMHLKFILAVSMFSTRKMVPKGERAHELIPCIFGDFKNKSERRGDRTTTTDL